MLMNNFKLNDDKTELLVIHAKHLPAPVFDTLQVSSTAVKSTGSVRNIGAIFDSTLSYDQHIGQVCKSAFYSIRSIARIRRYLSLETTKTLVNAFVISKIDNCNSLLFAIPKHCLQRLQYVLKSAALKTCHAISEV
jgi:hypothetical protein